jgi:hypothetical protein
MYKLWGRLAYNPNTSDDLFKNEMAMRYPTVSSEKLFGAWSNVSSCIPKITELIQGSWTIDLLWWLEGCNRNGGFRTIEEFAKCKVADGSALCSIAKSAADSCFGKKSSYQLADEIEMKAVAALNYANTIPTDANTELAEAINTIKAMSYMTIYYAYKIRGATYLYAKQNEKAKLAMGNAYAWWMKYTDKMSEMYKGMDMQRVQNMEDWHKYDAKVLKEYTDLGGEEIQTSK